VITLGIETSCDETALSLIETREHEGHFECRVINSLVHSQAELHSAYGGVYPSLAKREHGKNLVPLLKKLLSEISQAPSYTKASEDKDAHTASELSTVLETFKSELSKTNPDLWQSLQGASFLSYVPNIDMIAVTEGPGLEPTLWVGINFARILGTIWNIPVVPVNHMEGHVVGSLLKSDLPYGTWQCLSEPALPALSFLISGGHTELVQVNNIGGNDQGRYEILGQTKDDAVGEAFDKVARLLGLPYPGGPHVSKLAHEAYEAGIVSPVKLPRPMIASDDLNFSFAGLKTAVLYAVQKATAKNEFTDEYKKGLAYEFEQAVAETLETKLRKAILETDAKSLIIGGGVSANHLLRKRFQAITVEYGIELFLPSLHISGDNALMIALAGALDHTKSGPTDVRPLVAHGNKRLS